MNLSLVAFALIMTLAPFTGAFAQSTEATCTSIDVRDFNPVLKEHFAEPRDQGRTGWCYGFSAADLITAETGKKVSAAHVAALYNKHIADNAIFMAGYELTQLITRTSMNDVYEGGYIRTAAKIIVKAGNICTEKDLPFAENIKFVEILDFYRSNIKKEESDQRKALWVKSIGALLKLNKLKHVSSEEIYYDLKNQNLNIVVEKLLTEKCQDTISVPAMTVKTVLRYANIRTLFMNNLNHVLDTGKPIGIEYQVNQVSNMDGNHASVLTGRRWKDGRCEYKVRNSWGKNCDAYKDGISCDIQEGSFWVPENTFYKMLHSFNYIK